MSDAPPPVVPIFSMPFAVREVPAARQLNPDVAQALAKHASANPAQRSSSSDPFCYQSRDDLLDWADGPVRQVCDEVLKGVWATAAAVNTFTPGQLESFTMQARGWFTIVQPNGCMPSTQHALTSWCAIYCVQAPPASAERADSGVLRLYESRLATMFTDATNSTMRIPFTPGHYSWRPVPGHLAVFPGFVNHEIPLIRSSESLTLIMIRARFVAPGQEGFTRW